MAKKKMSEGLENALQKLVDRLVERMEDASQSLEWNKGWIQTGHGWGLPRNISGSPYMGMNAFLLSLHAAENGYKMPIYMTHLQAKKERCIFFLVQKAFLSSSGERTSKTRKESLYQKKTTIR